MTDILFTPITLGELTLANRIVMSPMTRTRAGAGDAPTALNAAYYRQRASAGLIVAEGTSPCAAGKGYWRMPGIYTQQQIDGWAGVAQAVHAEGGNIVLQLMHCGRVVFEGNRGYSAPVLAPSALACPDTIMGPEGTPQTCAQPVAMTHADIAQAIAQFAQAARNARAAGLDGVELHAASGYLVHQFMNAASNQRSDDYGGSPEARNRFCIEVLAAMAGAIGPGRVGLRIAPGNPYNGMDVSDPASTYAPLLRAIDPMGLAYVHIMNMHLPELDVLELARRHCRAPLLNNHQLTGDSARALLASGRADCASFGRLFISNPDLPARLQAGAELAPVDFAKLYVGEAQGYTDYPAMA